MPFLPLRLAPLVLAATVALSGTATASVLVTVNKATQRMTVLVDGETRYSWPVSTGMKGYATPAGTFRPFRLEEEHYSKEWDDAPMPHSIFFTPAGHAIHGSNATRRLGSPASHGCIRVSPANAAKLFALVSAEGLSNTKVVVTRWTGKPRCETSDTSSATASPQTGTGLRRGGRGRALLSVSSNTCVSSQVVNSRRHRLTTLR